MKTIEITNEIFELLELYTEKNTSYSRTYSEIIRWWHDEVFSTRRLNISDKDFGRQF